MNISQVISNVMMSFLTFCLKAILLFSVIFFVSITLLLGINYLYMRYVKKDKYVSIKKLHPTFKTKNTNIFYNFLVEWPRQILKNNANPDRNIEFPFGTIAFIGSKGTGKSMGMVRMTKEILRVFPDAEVAGNMQILDKEILNHNYSYCRTAFDLFNTKNSKNHIVLDDNGNPVLDGDGNPIEIIYPMVKLIDEASVGFRSNKFGGKKNEEADFELLQTIANQRKQKEIYLFTVQRFHRVDKKLREQIDKIYKCKNIAGWMWLVPYTLEEDESQENTVSLKRTKGFLQYVRTQELCDAYDTREIIEDFVQGGLKSDDKEQK